MLTILLLSAAAVQAAPPAPPPPERKIVREVIVLDGKDAVAANPGDKKEMRRIVIREGGPKAGSTEDIRIVHMDKAGGTSGEHRMTMVDCDKGSSVTNEQTATDKDGKKVQTRIMICAKGDPAKRVEALQNAQKRIADNKDIPPETRDRITASLEAQIATLRAGQR